MKLIIALLCLVTSVASASVLKAPDVHIPGGQFGLPVYVDDNPGALSVDLVVTYDKNFLRLDDVRIGSDLEGWSLFYNNQPGILRTSSFSITPKEFVDSEVLQLYFTALPDFRPTEIWFEGRIDEVGSAGQSSVLQATYAAVVPEPSGFVLMALSSLVLLRRP